MPRRFVTLAWSAAACAYLLIVLGAIVRITGSGMGCGDHWPLCNGHLFPPLHDIGTVIEWSHRVVAALVSALVAGLAAFAWGLRQMSRRTGHVPPDRMSYAALGLLVLQVLLGALTVKLELPAWTVILHLGTAMLLLATLLMAARNPLGAQHAAPLHLPLLVLAFVTVLFGALTANLGAAAACTGFPLCNDQVWPSAGGLAVVHWIHRVLAYSLAASVLTVAVRQKRRGMWGVAALVLVQVTIGAATVVLGLPPVLQVLHVAARPDH